MAVRAVVGGEISISGLDAGAIARLRRALAYPNPEYLAYQITGQQAPDDLPRRLSALIEHSDGSISAPRGAVTEIHPTLAARGITWEDHRCWGGSLWGLCLQDGIKLRGYQASGAQAAKNSLQGLIVLPCGSGKTVLGIGALQHIGRTTLIVVPTRYLAKQWRDEVAEFLGIDIATFGSGKHEWGPVTVATKDAIDHHLVKLQESGELEQFGCLIVDECHRIPTVPFQRILSAIPARYRLGLTATPEREDGLSKLVEWSFGPRLMERTMEEMVAEGWLIKPRVKAIHTCFEYDMPDISPDDPDEQPRGWKDYDKLKKAIIRDTDRNKLIVDTVLGHNDTTLVLSNSKEHCYKLVEMLQASGLPSVAAITSDVRKKKQEELVDGLRDGSLQVAIATSLADEGLNIKRLSAVVLALPESSKKNATQKIGRTMRPCGSKGATIYDIVDIRTPILYNRWTKRRSVFRKMKLEVSGCPSQSLFD
jgi:superfamily II DNA or RNA helicase